MTLKSRQFSPFKVLCHSLCLSLFTLAPAQNQCDQIGLFLKSLSDKFSCKRCPINWWFIGLFENCTVLSKHCGVYFLGYIYFPTSGHTAQNRFSKWSGNWRTLKDNLAGFERLFNVFHCSGRNQICRHQTEHKKESFKITKYPSSGPR